MKHFSVAVLWDVIWPKCGDAQAGEFETSFYFDLGFPLSRKNSFFLCTTLFSSSYYLDSFYTLKQFCSPSVVADLHSVSMHFYISSLHFISMYHNLFNFTLWLSYLLYLSCDI